MICMVNQGRVIPFCFVCILLGVTLSSKPASGDDAIIKDKLAIIELVEDELSKAFSFEESTPHKVPHFEVLDRVYPKWHKDKPALARQFWLMHKFQAHLVFVLETK